MIVTTTPSLEGQTIESYLGPISAHVVFGVNIFSDIAASWRDVFGGRSQTYQKQLHRLTAAALQDLEQSAKKLRANAIVGLKMDYAEISGGGKAGMFMVVATGTAVSLSKDGPEMAKHTIVEKEKIDLLIEKRDFLDGLSQPGWIPEAGLFSKAVELRAHDSFELFTSTPNFNLVTYVRNPSFRSYLEMCHEERGYRWLLEMSLVGPQHLWRLFQSILKEHDDFQLVDLEPYLNGQKEADPVALIEACTLRQNLYLMQDKTQIEGLADLVRSRFVEVIKMSQKRTLLGDTKDVYFCPCGSEFLLHTNQCRNCNKNKWGLPYESASPEAAVANLISIADALASISD
jgi:uncharacterized protein YbjQ (UPF0145 family)